VAVRATATLNNAIRTGITERRARRGFRTMERARDHSMSWRRHLSTAPEPFQAQLFAPPGAYEGGTTDGIASATHVLVNDPARRAPSREMQADGGWSFASLTKMSPAGTALAIAMEMTMTKRLCATIAILVISGATVAGGPQKNKAGKHAKHERGEESRTGSSLSVDVHFSTGELRVIRGYYEPRYRSLPPGLRKKLNRGGSLPPGWRKKIEPMPVAVERELVVLPTGYRRGVIDGHAVIYNPRTQVMIDVAVLF
jgi:hypothetical protein